MTDSLEDARRGKLRTQILRVLNRVSGGLLEENILFADVNLHLHPRAELSEFRDEILALRSMSLVVTVRDTQFLSRKVRITTAGRAALAEAEDNS